MDPLGSIQIRIMNHLWKHGGCTVHDVHQAFAADAPSKPLAYTTYLTVMRNLTRRGFLDQLKGNRAHTFVPLIDERSYKLAQVRHARQDLCGGDVSVLLGYLAQDDQIDAGKREQILAIANR